VRAWWRARRRSGVETPVGKPLSEPGGEDKRRRLDVGVKVAVCLVVLRAAVVDRAPWFAPLFPVSHGRVRVIVERSFGSERFHRLRWWWELIDTIHVMWWLNR